MEIEKIYLDNTIRFVSIASLVVLLHAKSWAQLPFRVNGSAYPLSEGCYQLTSDDKSNDRGSLWCEVPLALENAFDMNFAINLGCNKKGGEGMAFVLQCAPDSSRAQGCPGGALGYAASSMYPCAGISPSLSVEIDTRQNKGEGGDDWDADHLTLVSNTKQNKPVLQTVRASNSSVNIKDCDYHKFRITWRPSFQELKVYFDDEEKLVYHGDLQEDFFKGHKRIFFGFTASTSDRVNTQTVCVNTVTLEIDGAFREKKKFDNSVFVYPNPTQEKITIDFELEQSQEVDVQLYNSKGEVVRRLHQNVKKDNVEINLPGLPGGIYYLNVGSGKNRVVRRILHRPEIRA